MNTIDIAGIRNARPLACFSAHRHRRVFASVLAATVGACLSLSSGPSAAAPPSDVEGSFDPTATLALDQGCEDGDAVMCNDLGVSYLRGLGMPSDVSLALRAFERACRRGSADGCGNLGALHESGAGVPASMAEASRLYDLACGMGCALGCSNLGVLYARGLGVPRDVDAARRLFTLACETGSALGCHNLLQFPPSPL